jgi:ribose-phosphate pyrophosphokinase
VSQPYIVFSTSSYGYFGDRLRDACGGVAGELQRHRFPDGERYMRVESDVQGRDVILVGGTISDIETLELFDLACAIVKYGALRLSLVIPYFGYSTMERAEKQGEVVVAKSRARLMSAIPQASMGNRVVLVDLHVPGIAHYFEGGIWPLHLTARPLVLEVARRYGGDDFVVGSTDAGRAKWVEGLAIELGMSPAYVYKRRTSGSKTEVTGVSAHVTGKPVVIYDDMIRTGGSLLGAARAYRDAGATDVVAVATHGLFPGEAVRRIEESGLVSKVICTDSHPRGDALRSDFLEVTELAPLLARGMGGAS